MTSSASLVSLFSSLSTKALPGSAFPNRCSFRYGNVRLSTVGRLKLSGFALLPTMARPHYDVVLPDVTDETLRRLEVAFDPPITNPARPGTVEG